MAHDVFISHAASDKKVAEAMLAKLENNGVKCWIAPRDIQPGATWGGAIIRAIETSKILVLIYSSRSNKSHQVLREVERAVQKDIVLLPFRIEDVMPSEDMEYFLSATHFLDALDVDIEPHLDQLETTISKILQIQDRQISPHDDLATEDAVKEIVSKVQQQPPPTISLQQIEPPARLGKTEPQWEFDDPSDESDDQTEGGFAMPAEASPNQSSSDPRSTPSNDLQLSQADRRSRRVGAKTKRGFPTATSLILLIALGAGAAWYMADSKGWLKQSPIPQSQPEPLTTEPVVEKPVVSDPPEPQATPHSEPTSSETQIEEEPVDSEPETVAEATVEPPEVATVESAEESQPSAEELAAIQAQQQAEEEARERTAALAALTSAAQSGDLDAQLALARNYEVGSGVDKNGRQAARWYTAAAEQGDMGAQHKLGIMYSTGVGVHQDFAKAVDWFKQAADQGHAPAQYRLGSLYEKGQGVPLDYAQAQQWYELSASQQNADAQRSLGVIFEFGLGVPKNYQEALRYYKLAADQGDTKAQLYWEELSGLINQP